MICNKCKEDVEGDLTPQMQRHWAKAHAKQYKLINQYLKDEYILGTVGLGHQTWQEPGRRIDYSNDAEGAVRYQTRRHRGPIKLAEE